MVQNGAAVTSHIQVRVSVVVEVSYRNTLPIVPFASHARFFGNVGESSVTVVVIKSRTQRSSRGVDIGCPRLDKIKIHQSILIVVNPAYARAHCFEIVLLVCLSRILKKGDACCLSHVGVVDLNRSILRLRRLLNDRLSSSYNDR